MLRWRAMNRLLRTLVGLAPVLALLALPANAVAQQDRSFNPQLFHPAPGPDEFVSVESAVPLRHKGWAIGLYFNYARNEFSVLSYDTSKMSAGASRADLI